MQSLSDIITRTINSLQWELYHELAEGATTCRITSDPIRRRHIIHLPQASNVSAMDYLHELAHAVLGEQHHLLSTSYFERGTSTAHCDLMVNPVLVATDWLADYILYIWAPDGLKSEIIALTDIVANIRDNQTQSLFFGGLIYAESVYYLQLKRHQVPRRYRCVTDILLAHDPVNPSVHKLRYIINDLAGLVCDKRLTLVNDDGLDVWKII